MGYVEPAQTTQLNDDCNWVQLAAVAGSLQDSKVNNRANCLTTRKISAAQCQGTSGLQFLQEGRQIKENIYLFHINLQPDRGQH